MLDDQNSKKFLDVLERIADALEALALAVDEDEEEFNVYVRSDVEEIEEEEADED